MKSSFTPFELDSLPLHRFKVGQYYRMAEAGILKAGQDYDLLDGQVIDLPPISPLRASVGSRSQAIFAKAGEGRWLMRARHPVALDAYNQTRPDVALVKPRADFYTGAHPQAADIFLLVEVADVSIQYEREEKLPAYARAGIQECWIVNLVQQVVEVYREPLPSGAYGFTSEKRDRDSVAPAAFPDANIKVTDLLGVSPR